MAAIRLLREIFFRVRRNNRRFESVGYQGGGIRRLQRQLSEDFPVMTIRNRVALGISAAAVAFSLALAPSAFAQDKMGKDDAMKKDTMSKDGMKKESTKDSMSKDHMSKDGMKKDDGMMKRTKKTVIPGRHVSTSL
jgi:pentapeptide MXKDX repeat protein